MATRRTTTKVDVPIPPSPNGAIINNSSTSPSDMSIIDSPAPSPWLPTPLEALLLSVYPGTLFLGSLFSTFTVNQSLTPYQPASQSYDPAHAPSYFAKKSNIFNVYFVKIGWVWITLAFGLFTFSHSSLGPMLNPKITRRRAQALARYTCVTLVWVAVTQWFFGAPLIDRGFRLTGGQCEILFHSNDPAAQVAKHEMGDVREALTHAACKVAGGKWTGGHDISGHVFLLILGSAMLWLELLPAVLNKSGLREARRILTSGGLVRSAAVESDGGKGGLEVPGEMGIGIKVGLGVAALSEWMLLMTAAYFHTWFEKFTGFLVAFGALYAVYFLPRAVPAIRQVLGMPGV